MKKLLLMLALLCGVAVMSAKTPVHGEVFCISHATHCCKTCSDHDYTWHKKITHHKQDACSAGQRACLCLNGMIRHKKSGKVK